MREKMTIEKARKIIQKRISFHEGKYLGNLESDHFYFSAKGFIDAWENLAALRDPIVKGLLEYGDHKEDCIPESRTPIWCECGWVEIRAQYWKAIKP